MKLDWLLHVCNYWDILWPTRHVFEWVNVWTRWTLSVRHNDQYMLALGFYYQEKKYLTSLAKLTERLWLIRPQCFCPSHCFAKVFIPHFLIRFDEGYRLSLHQEKEMRTMAALLITLSVTLGTNKLVSKMPLLHGITSLSAKVYNLPEKGYCTSFFESLELFQNSNLWNYCRWLLLIFIGHFRATVDFIFILMSNPYYSQKVPYFVVTQEPGVLLLDNILTIKARKNWIWKKTN